MVCLEGALIVDLMLQSGFGSADLQTGKCLTCGDGDNNDDDGFFGGRRKRKHQVCT